MTDISDEQMDNTLSSGRDPIWAILGIAPVCICLHFIITTWTLGLDIASFSPIQLLQILFFNGLRGVELAGLVFLIRLWPIKFPKDIAAGELLWIAMGAIILLQLALSILIKLHPMTWINWYVFPNLMNACIYLFFMLIVKMKTHWRVLFGAAIAWYLWKGLGPNYPISLSRNECAMMANITTGILLIISCYALAIDLWHRKNFPWQHFVGGIVFILLFASDMLMKIKI